MIWKPLVDLRAIKLTRNLPRRLPFKFTAPRSMFHATVNELQIYGTRCQHGTAKRDIKFTLLTIVKMCSWSDWITSYTIFIPDYIYVCVCMCVCVTKPVHHNLLGNQRHIHFHNNEFHSEMCRSSSENKWIWKIEFVEFVTVTRVEKDKKQSSFSKYNTQLNRLPIYNLSDCWDYRCCIFSISIEYTINCEFVTWYHILVLQIRLTVNAWLILGMHAANERRRYFVTTSLIGRVQA